MSHDVSRRSFFGGLAAALGVPGTRAVHGPVRPAEPPGSRRQRAAHARVERRLRHDRAPVEQRELLGTARIGDEGDEQRLEVLEPLRLPGRQHRAGDRQAPRREAGEHPADRRLGRSPRRRRHDVPAGRQESARRRAVLQLGLPARDQHQVDRDQAAARQGLSPGHAGDDQGRRTPARGARVRVSVQPEQPDRHHRHQAGSEAAARRHPGGHAGADRRGVSPLRRRSELRDVGAVRARRAVR